MRFFCLSDTHGGPPPAACRSMSGKTILHAGDFYNEGVPEAHSDWEPVLAANDLLLVRGNHDCVVPEGLAHRDLTMGLTNVGGVWVIGLGWSGRRYDLLPPEALMARLVIGLLEACSQVMSDGDRSILLTHYLPTGRWFKNREGWEFDCIARLVEALRPMAVVSGHRHGLAGRTFYQGDSLIVFPGPSGGWLEASEGAKWLG